jgi:hypothetical protein
MKRFIIALAIVLMAIGSAYAVKVGTFGIPNSSGTSPLEVDDNGNLTVSKPLTVDGSIYTPVVRFEGGVYLPTATLDPCPTLGPGAVFLNPSGVPCFCNNYSVDLSLYNGTTACF